MAIKDLISPGVGFAPGGVRFIVTRGLGGPSGGGDLPSVVSRRQRLVGGAAQRVEVVGNASQRVTVIGGQTHSVGLMGN